MPSAFVTRTLPGYGLFRRKPDEELWQSAAPCRWVSRLGNASQLVEGGWNAERPAGFPMRMRPFLLLMGLLATGLGACDSLAPRAGDVTASLRDTLLTAPAFVVFTLRNDSPQPVAIESCAGRPVVDVEEIESNTVFDPSCVMGQVNAVALVPHASLSDSVRVEGVGTYRLWFYVAKGSATGTSRVTSGTVTLH